MNHQSGTGWKDLFSQVNSCYRRPHPKTPSGPLPNAQQHLAVVSEKNLDLLPKPPLPLLPCNLPQINHLAPLKRVHNHPPPQRTVLTVLAHPVATPEGVVAIRAAVDIHREHKHHQPRRGGDECPRAQTVRSGEAEQDGSDRGAQREAVVFPQPLAVEFLVHVRERDERHGEEGYAQAAAVIPY